MCRGGFYPLKNKNTQIRLSVHRTLSCCRCSAHVFDVAGSNRLRVTQGSFAVKPQLASSFHGDGNVTPVCADFD